MRKYAFLLAIAMLFAVNTAYAEEITGIFGATSYNPEEISILFPGYAEKEGALAIMFASGGAERELGYVYGTLTVESGKLKVANGKFVSTGSQKVNITGELFYINAEEIPELKFSLQKADYIKDSHAIQCAEECSMSASVSPSESGISIRGRAEALNVSFYVQKKRGEEVNDDYAASLENLNKINILSTGENFTITAEDIDGTFGKMKIKAEKAVLSHMNYPAPYYEIISEQAEVFPEEGANIRVFSRTSRENAEGISIFIHGHRLFQLNRGNMFLTSEKAVYDYCNGGEERVMGSSGLTKPQGISWVKDSNNLFKLTACSHIDFSRNEIYVKPRTYAEANPESEHYERDIDYPFNLKIKLPAQNHYKKLDIGRFETFGNPSFVILEKEGVPNTALIFYKDNVVMPENGNERNWFEMGISFRTFVFSENRYQEFECRVTPETEQYSCTLDGRVWATSRGLPREFNPQAQTRCDDDSDCGAGKCIERLCVRRNSCSEVSGINPGAGGENKLDLLFIGNNYDDETTLENDIKKIMTDSSFDGLLTIRPYRENKDKFRVWKMNPEKTAWSPESNMYVTHRYANAMQRECPDIEHAIFMSTNEFRSFAEPGVNVFISMRSIEQRGKGLLLAHEFGHAFGKLWDEYYNLRQDKTGLAGEPNCIKTEEEARRVWTGILGNAAEADRLIQEEKSLPEDERGCGGDCGDECKGYFKPSSKSIMNTQRMPGHNTYNDVSRIAIENRLAAYS
ncbi:MAG: M64 family metallopeptidase [Candidatus Nanoarchaeia archaeon]|nr:M64 family metallopeptidase [Candidatus Nanoarchaeia archaeon]